MLNKLLFFTIIQLLFVQISFAADTLNVLDDEGKKQGWWIILNANKQLANCDADKKVEEGKFINNQKNGLWKTFNCSGKLKAEMTFVNDRKFGFARIYYLSGNIMEEGIWQGNKWVGKYKFYHENGQLYYDFSYNDEGKREGQQKYYHDNGKLMVEGTWHDSKETGVIKEYNKDGKLITESAYNDGKIDENSIKTYKPETEKAPEIVKEIPIEEVKPTVQVKPVDIGLLSDGFHKTFDRKGRVNKEGEFKKGVLIDGKVYIYEGDKHTKTNIIKGGSLLKTVTEK